MRQSIVAFFPPSRYAFITVALYVPRQSRVNAANGATCLLPIRFSLPGMERSMRDSQIIILAVAVLAVVDPAAIAQSADADSLDFFEKKVRPVLVEHCYACHSAKAKKVKGGLLLDSHDGLLKGGDTGAVVVPGEPGKSR